MGAAAQSVRPSGGEPNRSSLPPWRLVVGLLAALFFAGIALGQLQALLSGMHLSGRPSSSIGGLNHLFHLGADAPNTAGTISVWHEYAAATASQSVRTADPYRVVWWAVLVDSVLFAPLYVATLVAFFRRARAEVKSWGGGVADGTLLDRCIKRGGLQADEMTGWYLRIAVAGAAFIGVAGVADEIENASNLLLVRHGWSSTPDYGATWFHVLAWALWLSGWVKVALFVAAVGAALILGWALIAARPGRVEGRRRIGHRLVPVRLHLGVVVVTVLVLFAHEQMPDLVRRWTPVGLVLDLALAGALALAVWATSLLLLTSGPVKRIPNWTPRRLWIVLAAITTAAVVQVVVHFTVTGSYHAGWGLAVPAGIVLLLAGLSVVLPSGSGRSASTGAVATRSEAGDTGLPILPRLLASGLIVGLALGILQSSFGYAVYAIAWSWWVVPILAAPVGALLVWHLVGRRGEPLAWTTAAATVALIVLWVSERGELDPSLLVTVSFLLLLAGLRLYDALAKWGRPHDRLFRLPVLVVGGLVLATLYGIGVAFPWWTGERFSAIGVLLFFFLIVTVVGTAVIWGAPALPVPRSLRVLHFRQFPILTFCVVWFLVAGQLDKGGYHNIRVEQSSAAAAPVTLQDAFACWLGKNGLEQNRCSSVAARKPVAGKAVPLVVVATTGGGIRAAYWTDLVLTCAFEVDPKQDCQSGKLDQGLRRSDAIFAASGISGGSLGLASYAAYLTEKTAALAAGRTPPQRDWVKQRLDRDALSASGAWWLLVELPRAFLQFRSPTDRAGILEQGWERAWPDGALGGGLFALWRDHPEAPLLLLNGTSVDDGCRFETSVLDGNVETTDGVPVGCRSAEPFDDIQANPATAPPLGQTRIAARSVLPATRDLVDFLCGQNVDIRLSTAALLSARFPFVNPSARVERRCDIPGARRPVAYVVDGGYLDTSGASPVAELTPRLDTLIGEWNQAHAGQCIVPLMIQIDNGFSSSAARPPRRPAELLVPLKTVFATRGAREAEGRVEAALEYDDHTAGTTAVNRYARFVNQSHPGPHAPLGWTQSRFSERELTGQLSQDANTRALAEVRNWLQPGALTCS